MSAPELIAPYGGALVDLVATGDERSEILARASRLRSLRLSARSLHDLELLAVGAFSPLSRFMAQADYEGVLDQMRLADGRLWPMPITLPIAVPDAAQPGDELALRDAHNDLVAVLAVEERYSWEPAREAEAILGSVDAAHPLVSEMASWGRVYVSGPLRVLKLPRPLDFASLRLTPADVRARLRGLGNPNVVAFQTRNPLHRSHEELTRRAAAACDGTLLLHPVVGLTKPGDVDHYTRVRTYQMLVERYYDRRRTLLALLPLAMRMAGPREALWHAIIRRNYGANHFIVGRDHAGPGLDSHGRPFFEPYAAQELVARHAGEIGIRMLSSREVRYLPVEDRYEEEDRIPPGVETASLSGTQVREHLDSGRPLPAWFTRPETAAILAEVHPPRHAQGFCVFFTGLSGAGKSATAEALTTLLLERGRRVTVLDGDVVRTQLSKGLGFSREDRDTNIRRIGFVASEIVRHGGAVVCAAVSPYADTRRECRAMMGRGRFVEVWVDTPLDVCEQRDTKGLYAMARRGELPAFTGISDPYEPPQQPELRLTTEQASVADNARRVLGLLIDAGFVRA